MEFTFYIIDLQAQMHCSKYTLFITSNFDNSNTNSKHKLSKLISFFLLTTQVILNNLEN